ncbi:MAG: hypothetical protein PUP92_31495 [Rhizonema sp. PD38]|nr:hypothetical protein [Rhizonema sp. PD38]
MVQFTQEHDEDGSLMLSDDGGNHTDVASFAFFALFTLHANHVKCLLLNACYSQKAAVAISQHINYQLCGVQTVLLTSCTWKIECQNRNQV